MVNGFLLPFRVGKKQKRAVLDAKGQEVIIFNDECLALEYVDLMNKKFLIELTNNEKKLILICKGHFDAEYSGLV